MEIVANKEVIIYDYEIASVSKYNSQRIDRLCNWLIDNGVIVKRYFLKENQEQFRKNKDVWCLVMCSGTEMLPATYVDGHIMKIEEYPTEKEINAWLKKT